MTPLSVVGVKLPKPAATPGSGEPSANVVIELLAGVTPAVEERRSAKCWQCTPTALSCRNCSISVQLGPAWLAADQHIERRSDGLHGNAQVGRAFPVDVHAQFRLPQRQAGVNVHVLGVLLHPCDNAIGVAL